MNILVIGNFHTESFALHIAETLEDMAHIVLRFEPGKKARHITNDKFLVLKKARNTFEGLIANTEFVRKKQLQEINNLLNAKVDLTIVTHDFLYPNQISDIKIKTKAPIILWHPDSISNLGKYFFLNAKYDALFFKDPYIVYSFNKDLNLNSYYLPECFNPRYHKKVNLDKIDLEKYGCDITIAGNFYPNREAFFRNLIDYNIKIWGPPAPLWLNITEVKKMLMNEMVFYEDKAKAFLAAKIVLNNLHPAEIWGINCRAFEIPACGGFQMINYRKGLNQLFEIDKEVISFNNYDELIKKIDYYLSNNSERAAIAEAGRIRAYKDHTYTVRLQLILDTIFKNAIGYEMPGIKFT